MSVYVDQSIWQFKNMIMCHMIADDIKELHKMADLIGIKRKWFQNKKIPHYDICKTKRKLAIENGAIEIDIREFIKKTKELQNDKS
jgi:hypothetical protein